jgi:hypothetical protein
MSAVNGLPCVSNGKHRAAIGTAINTRVATLILQEVRINQTAMDGTRLPPPNPETTNGVTLITATLSQTLPLGVVTHRITKAKALRTIPTRIRIRRARLKIKHLRKEEAHLLNRRIAIQ